MYVCMYDYIAVMVWGPAGDVGTMGNTCLGCTVTDAAALRASVAQTAAEAAPGAQAATPASA